MTLERIRGPLLGSVVFLGAIALWELWAQTESPFLVPSALDIAERAWEVWTSSEYLTLVATSLTRIATGFALGSAIGLVLGLAMGSWNRVGRALEPLTELLRATPAIAIVPVALLVFGFAETTYVAVIAFAVCFPVLVNTVDGVRAVSPEIRDTASMLHVHGVERAVRVYLPAALPSVFAGLRLALSGAIVVLIVAELAIGGSGVGRYVQEQEFLLDIEAMYAGILFLGVLGYVLNALFVLVERRLLAWHHGAAGEPTG